MSAYIIDDRDYIALRDLFFTLLMEGNKVNYKRSYILAPMQKALDVWGQSASNHVEAANCLVRHMQRINVESVNYRYSETTPDGLDLPSSKLVHFSKKQCPAIIKWFSCWDYQSCEHTPDEVDQKFYDAVKAIQVGFSFYFADYDCPSGWPSLNEVLEKNDFKLKTP